MIRFAALGLDHRHIYHLIGGLLDAGAECVGYCTRSTDPKVVDGVRQRFPNLTAVDDPETLLTDPRVELVACAAVPAQRAAIAVDAMRRGKDVLVDKPGVTTFEQLAAVERTVQETGRLFSICFSERHTVPAMEVVTRLVRDGAIGRVLQTLGMGPHRLNAAIRPAWFFETAQTGGILIDIASHQIDQFLTLTGASDADVLHSAVGHHGSRTPADFQDFGEVVLQARGGKGRGYVRVDWFTPDGLPTWGDGRLFVLGTDGHIEVRKYLDIEGRSGTDHVYLADRTGTRHIEAASEPLTFFRDFVHDVRHRTHTAMNQTHVFTVSRLALQADAQARGGARS